MKAFLVIAVAIFSQTSFASKARISSLQNADHLIDTQTVFTNPAHINMLSPYITFEMGASGAGAEGGFARKLASGSMLAAYVGHDNTNDLRDGTLLLKQRNPVEVIFGMNNMAFSGSLSTTDDKKNGKKETTLVGKFGMTTNNMSFWSNLAVISQAEDKAAPTKINTAPQIVFGGDMTVQDNRFYGTLGYGQYKKEAAAVSTTTKDLGIKLGWSNRGMKNKDADIYYGTELNYGQRDVEGKKITATSLPLFLGMEYNVTPWAIFRGSVKQNFIIGENKDETAVNTDAQSAGADTTFAGGLGLKYNQITLDGSLAASTNGAVNGNAFLTQASVTYNF
jgi:hypothetical protein